MPIIMEEVLIKACSNKDYSHELKVVTDFFDCDFDKPLLETQLQLLSCMEIKSSESRSQINFRKIHKHSCALPTSQVMLLSQVAKLVKFVLLMPATNTVSERSASAMQRSKLIYDQQ